MRTSQATKVLYTFAAIFFCYGIFFYDFCLYAETGLEKVSLEQAKKYAISNNFKVKASEKNLEAVKAQHGRTLSSFYPQLGMNAGVNAEATRNQDEMAPVGYIAINQNIFNGFKDSYNRQIKVLEVDKATIQLEQLKFEVGLEVEGAFHRYLYYKEVLSLKEQAIALNGDHKKLLKRTRAAGLGSDADVMEFDLTEAILESDLLSLRQDLEEARINLKRLLGEEVGQGIEPVGGLQHQHLKKNLMSYLQKVKDSTAAVKLAAIEEEIGDVNARSWRSSWLPSIDLQVKAGYLPLDERVEEDEPTANILLVANFPIFTGFGRAWERREKLAVQGQAQAELKQSILNALSDIEVQYRRLKTIETRVDLELGNLERSKKYYAAVKSEYLRGYKNSADLSSAANQLYTAQERQKQYMFEFLRAKLILEKTLGSSIETEIIENHPTTIKQ